MVLADQLVERLRAQPVGERLSDRGAAAPGCTVSVREQVAHRPITTASLRPARAILSREGRVRRAESSLCRYDLDRLAGDIALRSRHLSHGRRIPHHEYACPGAGRHRCRARSRNPRRLA
jgi:hypothetical protein